MYRNRGMLGKFEFIGRNKDKTPQQEMSKFDPAPSDRIELNYYDKRGRKLTQKEAFRMQCWTFHGKMPSQRKQEKAKMKEKINSTISNMDHSKDSRLSMALDIQQKKSGMPGLVLDIRKNN